MKEILTMANPKFNYDNPDFYDAIYTLASRGCTDAEIARGLEDLAGTPRSSYPDDIWPNLPKLDPDTFGRMKSGKYKPWQDDGTAEERSVRINRVLARARDKILMALRGKTIQLAMGQVKTKVVVSHQIRKKCECNGKKEDCQICGGSGWYFCNDKQIVEEREQTCAPSTQMLALLLHHYDPEWRRVELMRKDENPERDTQVTGIDIQVVFNDKKDLELQDNTNKSIDHGCI